jgi:hypothetical protein
MPTAFYSFSFSLPDFCHFNIPTPFPKLGKNLDSDNLCERREQLQRNFWQVILTYTSETEEVNKPFLITLPYMDNYITTQSLPITTPNGKEFSSHFKGFLRSKFSFWTKKGESQFFQRLCKEFMTCAKTAPLLSETEENRLGKGLNRRFYFEGDQLFLGHY